ncbi:MAG: hypothetical protein V4508_23100, partial [Pseudomonadota bacterium]
HTYRLLIVKELYSVLLAAHYEALCSLQQRDEIMRRFAIFVNLYFCSPHRLRAAFQRGGEL